VSTALPVGISSKTLEAELAAVDNDITVEEPLDA
jgi:hypothetical protein